MEIWKDIKGYSNYQISTEGRVWKKSTQRYMKPIMNSNGHYQVSLTADNGKYKKEYIHRLMAIAFIPNPKKYPNVHHIDGNKTNNVINNLCWIAQKEHVITHMGTQIKQYSLNMELIAVYDCYEDAAKAIDCNILSLQNYFRQKEKGRTTPFKGFYWERNRSENK